MSDAKRLMLEGRLHKRMRKLNISSHDRYCQYLFSDEGRKKELIFMIDEVTTNKTDFFREAVHFDYLQNRALPELLNGEPRKRLKFWSAGCSSGEEPYTLAMVLEEYRKRHPGVAFDYEILATDLSTKVLKAAQMAIYPHDRVEPVPLPMRKKYLLRSKDRSKDRVRIVPELRSKVRFQRLNFVEDSFNLRQQFDVIFCRNVIIYFDRSTREALMRKFMGQLAPGGFFFPGHSETLHDLKLPLIQAHSNVYRKAS